MIYAKINLSNMAALEMKGVVKMPKQNNYNVGIYVRLSKDDERLGESVSIENQKLILEKYVVEQGWKTYDIYVDDGFSGTDFNRPAVTRLLEDAKTGKINLIIVKDLSRFGRNYIQIGQYIDYIFPTYNIRFIALNDNVDTANKDTSAMDMMPIVNLFNEWHYSYPITQQKLYEYKQIYPPAQTTICSLMLKWLFYLTNIDQCRFISYSINSFGFSI